MAPLDFTRLAGLTFEEADAERFPGLHLSWQALKAPEGTTAILNASNEVAVAAFLAGQLRFDRIHTVNLATLEKLLPAQPRSLADLMALNDEARSVATGVLAQFQI